MNALVRYRAAKEAYEQSEKALYALVMLVWREYQKQKNVVSTRQHFPWSCLGLDRYWFRNGRVHFYLTAQGRYGYQEERKVVLPVRLVHMAEDKPEALPETIAEIIAAEGASIARREALKEQKQHAAKLQKYEQLKAELAKYEGESA